VLRQTLEKENSTTHRLFFHQPGAFLAPTPTLNTHTRAIVSMSSGVDCPHLLADADALGQNLRLRLRLQLQLTDALDDEIQADAG